MKIENKTEYKSLHRDKLFTKGFSREIIDDLLGVKVIGFRVSKQKLFLVFIFVLCLLGALVYLIG